MKAGRSFGKLDKTAQRSGGQRRATLWRPGCRCWPLRDKRRRTGFRRGQDSDSDGDRGGGSLGSSRAAWREGRTM